MAGDTVLATTQTGYWKHDHPLHGLLCGPYRAVWKRGLDLAAALLLLACLLPLMLLLALCIVLDSPGGAIYVQMRTGQHGRRFRMYKFRTMARNAEELKWRYAHRNELVWPDFKMKHDPRITRAGRVLRKTSLDELPQLVNVVRGEMSLIGPRPTSFAASTYEVWHTQRLEAKPGISGLWQVHGRGEMLFDDRTRLEIRYVQQPCLLIDLALVGQTVLSVATGRGAF